MQAPPYRLIPLRNRAGDVIARAIVDEADYADLNRWTWCSSGRTGYAMRGTRRGGNYRTIFMHRYLLGLEYGDPRQSDHINGNGYDNRRANLRIATRQQNQENRECGWGSSRYRGVSWISSKQRWRATGRLNGRNVYLGSYRDEREAAAVVAAFRREHMPYATN